MTDHSMELAASVPLRITLRVLGLAGAILAEILRGFRRCVCKQFHFDSTKWFS